MGKKKPTKQKVRKFVAALETKKKKIDSSGGDGGQQ